jgi:UDP-N-acetyl-D-glucosamine/UDP-N-acetyl-D-galactosamine dehydrogenase
MFKKSNHKIVIIGLGYVGLPIFLSLSKKFDTHGYDLNEERVSQLHQGIDINSEFQNQLSFVKRNNTLVSSNANILKNCNFFIVTVPTPVTSKNIPDLSLLKKACKTVAKYLSKNSIVVFESTVYPSTTENICVPILSKFSNKIYNKDFFVGYSPERINPGDKKHTFKNINKVISASNTKTLETMDFIYSNVIKAKIFKAKSIIVAEASKIIENTQRDVNIALMNELSSIFKKLDIKTSDVIDAAKTKWNFHDYKPGLVGGHCIGVDPYYLTFIAKKLGINTKVILSGRKINDQMGISIAKEILSKCVIKKPKVLVMGITYKENCNDLRNSKSIDITNYFKKRLIPFHTYDPNIEIITQKKIPIKKNINLVKKPKNNYYDIIIVSVAHKEFKELGLIKIKKFGKKNVVIYDVKNIFNSNDCISL